MIHLVYVSSATVEMTDTDLIFLLNQSRERNLRQNVTGMLLYCGGNFIQVLEGEAQDVEDIYDSIIKDDRNSGNIIVIKREISKRDFPDWSMGFKRLGVEDKGKLSGFTEFLDKDIRPEELTVNPSNVLKLLYQFKNVNL